MRKIYELILKLQWLIIAATPILTIQVHNGSVKSRNGDGDDDGIENGNGNSPESFKKKPFFLIYPHEANMTFNKKLLLANKSNDEIQYVVDSMSTTMNQKLPSSSLHVKNVQKQVVNESTVDNVDENDEYKYENVSVSVNKNENEQEQIEHFGHIRLKNQRQQKYQRSCKREAHMQQQQQQQQKSIVNILQKVTPFPFKMAQVNEEEEKVKEENFNKKKFKNFYLKYLLINQLAIYKNIKSVTYFTCKTTTTKRGEEIFNKNNNKKKNNNREYHKLYNLKNSIDYQVDSVVKNATTTTTTTPGKTTNLKLEKCKNVTYMPISNISMKIVQIDELRDINATTTTTTAKNWLEQKLPATTTNMLHQIVVLNLGCGSASRRLLTMASNQKFFNSTYHWLLIEEDYNIGNFNYKNNNKNSKYNSNYRRYVKNNNNNNKNKSNNVKKSTLAMMTATNTISSELSRKLKQTLSTSMSAAATTTTTTTMMPAKVEKLTTLAIDITENYQQQQQQQQQHENEEKLNSLYFTENSAILDRQRKEYATKRQIAAVTPITATTTNIREVESSSSIDNILQYGKKANCESKETDKRCIVNLDTTTTQTTNVATTNVIVKNQIDDVDGYNIDIIEKFLQQLEININTELILAKRRWHQQQHSATYRRTKVEVEKEEEDEYCSEKKCNNIERVVMAYSHQCVNKTTDNNVNDITTTTKTTTRATILNDKHLNNDTSTRFAYNAMPCCCTFKSLSTTTNATTGMNSKFMYELTDDYLLHDIWSGGNKYGGTLNITQIGTFSAEQGLKFYDSYEKTTTVERRMDLTGLRLRCLIVVTNVNRTDTLEHYLHTRYNTHLDSMNRFSFGLLSLVRDLNNFSYILSSTKSWGYLKNGTFDGMIGALIRDETDVGGSPIFFRLERAKVIDYTTRTWIARPCFIFRHPRSTSKDRIVFLQPFSNGVWICLVCSGLITTILFRLQARFETKLSVKASKRMNSECAPNDVTQPTLFYIGTLCQQGISCSSNFSSGHCIIFTTLLFSVCIYQFYSASIVGTLLMQRPKTIRTLAELTHSSLEIGIEEIIYNRYFFEVILHNIKYCFCSNLHLLHELQIDLHLKRTTDKDALLLYNLRVIGMPTKGNVERVDFNKTARENQHWLHPEVGLSKVKRGGYAFHVDIATAYKIIREKFTEKEICELTEIQLFPPQKMMGIVQKKSPLRKTFTYGLRRITESGLADYQRKVWQSPKPVCVKKLHNDDLRVELTTFLPAIYMLFLGHMASLVALLAEIIVQRLHFSNKP